MKDLPAAFQDVGRELLESQRELSGLYEQSADPVAEAAGSARRSDLATRRDALLARWGRIGLSWMLSGGEIRLGGLPEASESDEPAGTAATPLETTVVVTRGDRGPAERLLDGSGLDRTFGSSWTQSAPPRVVPLDVDRLRDVLQPLAEPPRDIPSTGAVLDELRRLGDNTLPQRLSVWTDFPKEVQRALIGMCVARARHVQDEISADLHPIDIEPMLDRFFSGMTAFSKREQPGFVFGLRRHHHPVGASWEDDAHRWWSEVASRLPEPLAANPDRALDELRGLLEGDEEPDEERVVEQSIATLDAGLLPEDPRLVALMAPHLDKLRKHTRFKRLRKAIRDAAADDDEFAAEMSGTAPTVDEAWTFFPLVRGRNAAIVGGDLTEDARERISEAFGFSSVEWLTTDSSRDVQGLVTAIRGGGIDFVIVLRRFIGQNVDRSVLPACRATGVPWVSVERGYGVPQIRAAIERFLTNTADDD